MLSRRSFFLGLLSLASIASTSATCHEDAGVLKLFDCPAGQVCSSWNDGCNECGCESATAIGFCTFMFCPWCEGTPASDECIPVCHDNSACVPAKNNNNNDNENNVEDMGTSTPSAMPFDEETAIDENNNNNNNNNNNGMDDPLVEEGTEQQQGEEVEEGEDLAVDNAIMPTNTTTANTTTVNATTTFITTMSDLFYSENTMNTSDTTTTDTSISRGGPTPTTKKGGDTVLVYEDSNLGDLTVQVPEQQPQPQQQEQEDDPEPEPQDEEVDLEMENIQMSVNMTNTTTTTTPVNTTNSSMAVNNEEADMEDEEEEEDMENGTLESAIKLLGRTATKAGSDDNSTSTNTTSSGALAADSDSDTDSSNSNTSSGARRRQITNLPIWMTIFVTLMFVFWSPQEVEAASSLLETNRRHIHRQDTHYSTRTTTSRTMTPKAAWVRLLQQQQQQRRRLLQTVRGGSAGGGDSNIQYPTSLEELEEILQQASTTLTDNGDHMLVVLDFYADHCPPCEQVAPLFEELSMEFYDKAVFVKVHAHQQADIAQKYGVTGWPTFVFVNGQTGQVMTEIVGGKLAEATLYDWVKLFTQPKNNKAESTTTTTTTSSEE